MIFVLIGVTVPVLSIVVILLQIIGIVTFYTEWRYWLWGFGWRDKEQLTILDTRFTIFFGPWRWTFGKVRL